MTYNPAQNSKDSYDLAIEACREKLESFPMVEIGDCTLYQGDCLEIMPLLPVADHIICDPPYEHHMHAAKAGVKIYGSERRIRIDGNANPKCVDFASIEELRLPFVKASEDSINGWFIAFCTPEGAGRWADAINLSSMKYKRACTWVKPDSTPQLNGQCPAMGAENFVCAWAGRGHSKWNGGGKRGVYTYCTNQPDRHGKHPTEKPWRLMAALIKDFTNQGQAILDPFMGSGTTGVACAKMGRKFTGIELDPKYFDIACERITEAYKQPDLFIEQPKQEMKQQDIFEVSK